VDTDKLHESTMGKPCESNTTMVHQSNMDIYLHSLLSIVSPNYSVLLTGHDSVVNIESNSVVIRTTCMKHCPYTSELSNMLMKRLGSKRRGTTSLSAVAAYVIYSLIDMISTMYLSQV